MKCRKCDTELAVLAATQSEADSFMLMLFGCPNCRTVEDREVMKFEMCSSCPEGCPSWKEGWGDRCFENYGKPRIKDKVLRLLEVIT